MNINKTSKQGNVIVQSIRPLREDEFRHTGTTLENSLRADGIHELQLITNSIKGDAVSKDDNLTPDDILAHLGGCGTFQFLLAFLIQFMNIGVCWGLGGYAFFAYVPEWRCLDYHDVSGSNESIGTSMSYIGSATNTNITTGNGTQPEDYWNKKCQTLSGAKCTNFEFENSIHTLVSEFDLVCDKSWVTASITSMQMIGMTVGSIVVGNLSDLFGRKKPFIFSMAIMFVFQLVCYFAFNWIMFAVGRVVVGVGSAFFLSIYCVFQGEYVLSKWRSTTISFPSWALEMCLFTLFAWLLHDWEHITLIISLGSLAFMASWFFIPESFRWLIAKNRLSDVHAIIKQIGKWNKRPIPESDRIIKAFTVPEEEKSKNYSILVLFTKPSLLKLTVPLMTGWYYSKFIYYRNVECVGTTNNHQENIKALLFALGAIGYGISFGIKKLSGNLFLNLFFFSIVATPSKVITIFLQNRIGRKLTIVVAYALCLISGTIVGVLQYIETPLKGSLTNGFALAANAGIDGAWGPMQTLTVEVYPTLARNTGFGFHSTLARLGAVLGPQVVYLEDYVPGLLYFVVAGLAALSILCIFCLPETMNTTLPDKITEDLDIQRKHEHTLFDRKSKEMKLFNSL